MDIRSWLKKSQRQSNEPTSAPETDDAEPCQPNTKHDPEIQSAYDFSLSAEIRQPDHVVSYQTKTVIDSEIQSTPNSPLLSEAYQSDKLVPERSSANFDPATHSASTSFDSQKPYCHYHTNLMSVSSLSRLLKVESSSFSKSGLINICGCFMIQTLAVFYVIRKLLLNKTIYLA